MKRLFFVFLAVVFWGQLCIVGCAGPSVNSLWVDESIQIDGEISEWESAMLYDEKLDASYGFQNDGEYLYIAMETGNPALKRQLLMSGLVIWVNDTGDKTRDVGFKFPRGLMERRVPARDLLAALGNPNADDRQLQYLIDYNFRDLQVLDPRHHNLGIYTQKEAATHNIQFDLAMKHGLMIYELKIPLQGSDKHPWRFSDVTKIGVGFATPQMDFSGSGGRRPMGGGMMDASSGGGGRRGGGSGMGGGMSGGMSRGFGPSKPIDVWVSATMATAP